MKNNKFLETNIIDIYKDMVYIQEETGIETYVGYQRQFNRVCRQYPNMTKLEKHCKAYQNVETIMSIIYKK